MLGHKKKKSPSCKKREMSFQERYDRETRMLSVIAIVIAILGIAVTVLRSLLQ